MSDTTNEEPAALVERRGHTMLITFNRPQARNAVNQQLWIAVGTALEEAENDPDVRAVAITGAGEQSFCAGADLKALARGEKLVPDDPVQASWGFGGIVSHVISKPLIAAVNGTALGGGTEITLACDLAVASTTATFGLPEVKRGIIAGAGGAFRIMAQVPHKIALELLLTGDTFDALTAKELGLVNRVVEPARLLEEALALAGKIAGNAPLAVRASKRLALGIFDGTIPDEETGWQACRREAVAIMQSEDAKEGPRAFAEKRAPVWKGR